MKRAGISLALAVLLLLGAAVPVRAQAAETGLAAEAESFYRSVLAAKDRETLQTYLDCFSDQRRAELRAELPAALRQELDTVLQQMELPSLAPMEENTQQKETGWQLDASATWDDAAGSYTLRLETSGEAGGTDAVIRYTWRRSWMPAARGCNTGRWIRPRRGGARRCRTAPKQPRRWITGC